MGFREIMILAIGGCLFVWSSVLYISSLISHLMADNRVDSPVTPEITKSSGVELRRHSTGKTSSGNSEEKVLPHYLRASTGSCHDFCKYGGKQAFEANENRSILKRVARKPVHQRSNELRASTGSSKSTAAFKAKEMKLSSKPNSVTEKTMFSKNPSEGFSGQRDSELRMEKKVATSKVAASINARKHKGLKIVPHLKNHSENNKDKPKQHSDVEAEQKTRKNNPKQHNCVEVEQKTRKDRSEQHSDVEVEQKTRKDSPEQHSDVEVEEKTLHVIKIAEENKILQSDQNASHDAELSPPQPKFFCSSSSQSSSQDDHEESEYTTSEVEEDSILVKDEGEHIENGDNVEVDQKGKPKKDGTVDLEDKDRCQITKLKFRRGKWVEIKSEKSSPRRLKFRRGRILGETENGKSEAQRRICKRRDGDVGESNVATTGAEKVVLRHQDVQGKKDEQGLFNNVIEETATKLAETRKSKVKALVGAFETVISLQERKLSASTGI